MTVPCLQQFSMGHRTYTKSDSSKGHMISSLLHFSPICTPFYTIHTLALLHIFLYIFLPPYLSHPASFSTPLPLTGLRLASKYPIVPAGKAGVEEKA